MIDAGGEAQGPDDLPRRPARGRERTAVPPAPGASTPRAGRRCACFLPPPRPRGPSELAPSQHRSASRGARHPDLISRDGSAASVTWRDLRHRHHPDQDGGHFRHPEKFSRVPCACSWTRCAWNRATRSLLRLAFYAQRDVSEIPRCRCVYLWLVLFHCQVIFHCADTPHWPAEGPAASPGGACDE